MLSVAVMMHPSRECYRDYLTERLGNVPIILDRGQGIWDTSRRAWLEYEPTADFHLVVQDDAIICDDFYRILEPILGDHATCLYYGNRAKYRRAAVENVNKGGVMLDKLLWGLAVALPTSHVEAMVAHGDKATHIQADDFKIADYLTTVGMRTYYPLPSLVDHRHTDSLVGNESHPNRVAMYYVDRKS